MPSGPLSAERSAVVKLHARIDVQAIDITRAAPTCPATLASSHWAWTDRVAAEKAVTDNLPDGVQVLGVAAAGAGLGSG